MMQRHESDQDGIAHVGRPEDDGEGPAQSDERDFPTPGPVHEEGGESGINAHMSCFFYVGCSRHVCYLLLP